MASPPTTDENMIFQLATPVQMRIAAPMRIAMAEVSPTEPGIVPMNMSMKSVPAAMRPSGVGWASGVAPDTPSISPLPEAYAVPSAM